MKNLSALAQLQAEVEKLNDHPGRLLAQFQKTQSVGEILRSSPRVQELQGLFQQLDGQSSSWDLFRSLNKQINELLLPNSIDSHVKQILVQSFRENPGGSSGSVLRQVAGIVSIADAASSLDCHLRPARELQNLFEKVQQLSDDTSSLQNITKQWEHASKPWTVALEAKRTLDDLWNTLRDIDLSAMESREESTQDARAAAQNITAAAVAEPTLQDAVDQIITAIKAQQNPSLQMTLWLYFQKVMEMIVSGIIGAVISQYVPQIVAQSPQEATKNVKEAARAVVSLPEVLADYRFVSAKVLVVRHNSKARSPELGRLRFGQTVRLIKKDKDFAMVTWKDGESGSEIQGWVFARYLSKLN